MDRAHVTTTKRQLQSLVYEFAHDIVGEGGLEVEIYCTDISAAYVEAKLRMDSRLTRLEIWPPAPNLPPEHRLEAAGDACMLTLPMPLMQIEDIVKGIRFHDGEEPDTFRHASAITLSRRGQDDVRIIFDSPANRDRAETSFRIIWKSVAQDHAGAAEAVDKSRVLSHEGGDA
jgi:hypothetical protein